MQASSATQMAHTAPVYLSASHHIPAWHCLRMAGKANQPPWSDDFVLINPGQPQSRHELEDYGPLGPSHFNYEQKAWRQQTRWPSVLTRLA